MYICVKQNDKRQYKYILGITQCSYVLSKTTKDCTNIYWVKHNVHMC